MSSAAQLKQDKTIARGSITAVMQDSVDDRCEFVFDPNQWQEDHSRLPKVSSQKDSKILTHIEGNVAWKCDREKTNNGKYCIFHISDNKGEEKNEEFIDNLVDDKLESQQYIGSIFENLNILEFEIASREGADIDLRHSSISEDLDITSSKISPNMDFSGSTIKGDISIFDSNIENDLLFQNTIINGNIFIVGSEILGTVDFTASTINGYIRIMNSEIPNIIDFSETGLVYISVESSTIGVLQGDTFSGIG